MTQTETTWDKLLQIKSNGRDDSHADRFHHPYEPTLYSVLERLANKGFIGKRDVVLDYGRGIPGSAGDRTDPARKKCEEEGVTLIRLA